MELVEGNHCPASIPLVGCGIRGGWTDRVCGLEAAGRALLRLSQIGLLGLYPGVRFNSITNMMGFMRTNTRTHLLSTKLFNSGTGWPLVRPQTTALYAE